MVRIKTIISKRAIIKMHKIHYFYKKKGNKLKKNRSPFLDLIERS
jgi:hypothetical protein